MESKNIITKNERANKLFEDGYELDAFKHDYRDDTPAIYCGTYGKYAAGSIDGMWIDIMACGDYETFMDVCYALHADESDPEFMFQDFENYPDDLYSEGHMDEETFDLIKRWGELSDKDREIIEAYLVVFGGDFGDALDDYEEHYCGQWDSEEDYAKNRVHECGRLHGVPDEVANYFDYERYARDLFMCDYTFENGHVFSRF